MINKNDHKIFSVHSICLTIESALFGLFVMAVSCDQVIFFLNWVFYLLFFSYKQSLMMKQL